MSTTPHRAGQRDSDKGFLTTSLGDYLQLLDWTARQTIPGRRGVTRADALPIFGKPTETTRLRVLVNKAVDP